MGAISKLYIRFQLVRQILISNTSPILRLELIFAPILRSLGHRSCIASTAHQCPLRVKTSSEFKKKMIEILDNFFWKSGLTFLMRKNSKILTFYFFYIWTVRRENKCFATQILNFEQLFYSLLQLQIQAMRLTIGRDKGKMSTTKDQENAFEFYSEHSANWSWGDRWSKTMEMPEQQWLSQVLHSKRYRIYIKHFIHKHINTKIQTNKKKQTHTLPGSRFGGEFL